MKLTHKNLDLVFDTIQNQMEDENGRGEFDEESTIEGAVEKVIEWIEDDKHIEVER